MYPVLPAPPSTDGREARPNGPAPAAWRAVHTRAAHEFQVRDRLTVHSISSFLPYFSRLTQWSRGRRRVIMSPLFPGYLFALTPDAHALKRIETIAGVARVIQQPIDDAVIAQLERASADPARVRPAYPAEAAAPGDPVTVTRGPLAGLTGRVVRSKTKARLIISVDIIGRACAVEIASEDVLGASSAQKAGRGASA